MRTVLINPKSSAITSFLLALPFVILFLPLILGVEPSFGPLEPLFRMPVDQPNVIGSAIVLGAWLLLWVAFVVGLGPIVQNVRAGNSMIAYPVNLLLAVATFLFITMFVGAIIVDQYPCWIGVPNCD